MKWILSVAMCSALVPVMLAGQKPAKSAEKTETINAQPQARSNEEQNIQAYITLLRSDLKKGRTQIMSDVMGLDATQAAAFWPIYKDFETDYTKIGDEIIALVQNYSDNYDHLTNELADQLATKLLDIEQKRTELKRLYYTKFKSALDPISAARFLQVENQIEKLLDLQISSQLPIAAEK